MSLSIRSAAEYTPPELSALLNQAFEGYFVPVRVDATFVTTGARNDSLNLASSQVVLRDGQAAGVGLVARRGWNCRLASFGIAPEHRGVGVGGFLLERLIDQARLRGDRSYTLECIEQNETGVRLYRRAGFQTLRRLVGYTAAPLSGHREEALEEVDPLDVARQLERHGPSDFPWQVSAMTLAQMTPPSRGYRVGPAWALITDPAEAKVSLRTLVVSPEFRRQGWGTRLVRAVAFQHPERLWNVSALAPEDEVSGFFEALGFVRSGITQLQMVLPLVR